MPVIVWKTIYETGIVAMDDEHRGLIREINRLYEAVRDKRGEEVLDDILTMLEGYTREHFRHEETLMAEYHYPALDEHRRVHQELVAAVHRLKEDAQTDKENLARELLQLLRNWLLGHIVNVDKKYGAYLESRGGRFIS